MTALDTNIVVRLIVQDDPEQAAIAARLLLAGCYIPDTVLLETAWLLRSRFGMRRAVLVEALGHLLDLPNIVVSDERQVRCALERFAAGADFADMMHLVSARGAKSFATFERRLDRQAGPDSPVPVEKLRA